jgi:hypothetical protein
MDVEPVVDVWSTDPGRETDVTWLFGSKIKLLDYTFSVIPAIHGKVRWSRFGMTGNNSLLAIPIRSILKRSI